MLTLSEPWSLRRGAHPRPDGSVQFEVWAPAAAHLELVIRGTSPDACLPMERDEAGIWRLAAGDVPLRSDYWYRVNGQTDRPDPVSRSRPRGVHGPSRIIDPAGFTWADDAWKGLAVR